MQIHPVTRVRAHEEVAEQLRTLMQRGELRPGDRLPPERELAGQFGVSRATIRQALSVLQAVGVVESRVGSGTFTRIPDVHNVTNLAGALRQAEAGLIEQLELRRIVEPQVAGLAAERAQPADVDLLEQHLAEQRAHVADPSFIDADSAFHLAIAEATKNSLLVKMVQGIHELLRESRELSWQGHGGADPLEQHQQIARAIERNDAAGAYSAMTDHVIAVERMSLETIANPDAVE